MGIEHKHAYRFVYLRSDEWQGVRLEALVREDGKCQICGEESIFNDAHHVVYPKSFWQTKPHHLVILCRPCHNVSHAFIKHKHGKCGARWKEWFAMICILKEWQASKVAWLHNPDLVNPGLILTSKIPNCERSPRWCFCCREESETTEGRNLNDQYGSENFWNLCQDCWQAMQINMEWPEHQKELMPMASKFLKWHREILVALGK